jgi:DNA uptake protein ComE-like DNA-binding protein
LFAVLLLVIAANFLLPQFAQPNFVEFSDFEEEVRQFEALMHKADKKDTLTPFPFDPNTLSHERWLELGLSKKQVDMIFNYKDAGGKFKNKDDVEKMYSISDEEFATLESFIEIVEVELKTSRPAKRQKPKPDPFPFNPNNIAEVDWGKLGLKEYQYHNILNYINAGGVYKVKNDLLKMYSISDIDYERLYGFILLPEKDTLKKERYVQKIKVEVIVEINSADSADFVKLRGIGPSYTRRIIKYRDLLGGYFQKEQLLEVFGMDTVRYNGFIENVELNTGLVQKMDLNEVEFKMLLKHPYVEYYIVKSIFNFKDEHGRFDSVSELRNVPLIYDELYQKLKHYLIVKESK